jgi:hypothetical protein
MSQERVAALEPQLAKEQALRRAAEGSADTVTRRMADVTAELESSSAARAAAVLDAETAKESLAAAQASAAAAEQRDSESRRRVQVTCRLAPAGHRVSRRPAAARWV